MEDLYRDRKAVVGVIGLGYVGMPLALGAVEAGFFVVGFDVDGEKTDSINAGQSYIKLRPSRCLGLVKVGFIGQSQRRYDPFSHGPTFQQLILALVEFSAGSRLDRIQSIQSADIRGLSIDLNRGARAISRCL